MKLFKQLVALAMLTITVNAIAADNGRKEAVMDMGKGGFTLTISVPDFADGPYDFAKNKGDLVKSDKEHKLYLGEAMFNAGIGESGVVVYQSNAIRRTSVQTEDQKVTAEVLAKALIKREGFEGRAQSIPCPPAPIEGAKIVCYKMTGQSIFEGRARPEMAAQVLAAISFANDTMGYTLMGTVVERNVDKFNADPNAFELKASKALTGMWKNSKIQKN